MILLPDSHSWVSGVRRNFDHKDVCSWFFTLLRTLFARQMICSLFVPRLILFHFVLLCFFMHPWGIFVTLIFVSHLHNKKIEIIKNGKSKCY